MKTTALIVTFNRLDKLKKCIDATCLQPFTHIVIVDNASTDGTQSWLNSVDDPRVIVLTQVNNNGGAGGFKVGCKFISEALNTDWVFMFDDDAYPEANLLARFDIIDKDDVHAYASLVRDNEENICKMNLPFKLIPGKFFDALSYISSPDKFLPDVDTPCRVATVSFVGAIIRSDILAENIDGIRDDLFLYYDDLYFGYLLFLKQYNIIFEPSLRFIHDISHQGKRILPEWKIYYLVRNLIVSKSIFPHSQPYGNFAISIRIVKYLLLTFIQPMRKLYLHYLIKGIMDGISYKTGMRHQSEKK